MTFRFYCNGGPKTIFLYSRSNVATIAIFSSVALATRLLLLVLFQLLVASCPDPLLGKCWFLPYRHAWRDTSFLCCQQRYGTRVPRPDTFLFWQGMVTIFFNQPRRSVVLGSCGSVAINYLNTNFLETRLNSRFGFAQILKITCLLLFASFSNKSLTISRYLNCH